MEEIWKPVVGYEGHYEISNLGNIVSIKKGKRILRKPQIDTWKYYKIDFWKNGKMKQNQVHRILFISFNGDIPPDMVINHIDGNKLNNKLSNLELVSQRENISHWQLFFNGIKRVGVYYYKQTNKFRAHISINGKLKHIGYYDTFEEACYAREQFEIKNNIVNKYL